MPSTQLTFAEMRLAGLAGKQRDRVRWQPRLEYWYEENNAAGKDSRVRNALAWMLF